MRRQNLCAALMLFLLAFGLSQTCPGQLLHQEGFNDDGDGTRYTLMGRGFEDLPGGVGPGMWEHNFLSSRIGLVSAAPAKRAAILFDALTLEFDWESAAFDTWVNLANWAMDGKENATIGFFPGDLNFTTSPSALHLSTILADLGHTIVEIPTVMDLPPAEELDLLIHTDQTPAPDPATAFVDYAVPGIFFNAPNHDDTAVAQIGTSIDFPDPFSLDVVAENADHPVLQGLPNPVPWTMVGTFSLEGMGNPAPGAKVLLTYDDPTTGQPRPALIVVDEGGGLHGSFVAEPEGSGFIVGADLDAGFGGGGFNDTNPRVLELSPVDISGQEDVMLTAALAATTADFEAPDFLRVLVGQEGDPIESFITLAEYLPVDDATLLTNKGLSADGGVTALSPVEFTDATWNISELAPGITDLVVRFEANSTFPNEIVGIDNIRIFAGEIGGGEGIPGDYNNSGLVEQGDLDLVLGFWGADSNDVPATWTNDLPEGFVDQAELDKVLGNWGAQAPGLGAAGAVPEPHTWALLLTLAATIALRRRIS